MLNFPHRFFVLLCLVAGLMACEKEEVVMEEEDGINLRPVIDAPFAVSAFADSLFELQLTISDPDNDKLDVWIEGQPEWLNFDTSTYLLSGIPEKQEQVNFTVYNIEVIASDGKLETSKEIAINVQTLKGIQEKLDEELLRLFQVSTNGLNGVSAAIVTPEGTLMYSDAGQLNTFSGGEIHPNHRYRMASVSKIFTAALVLRLQEEGLLSVEDHLFDYLPISGLNGGEEITILQLLSHTSGLADHLNDSNFWSSTSDQDTWTTQDIIDYAVDEGLLFSPGNGYAYSNTGFYLLGAVIEEVTNQPLSDAFQEWIFEPLSLEHTLYDDFSSVTNPIDSLALNARTYEYHQSAVGAAGAIVSSPADIARFGRALYGGEWLSSAALEAMLQDYGFTVGGDHYGLGTRLWDDNGYIHHGHTGALMDYRSILMYVPSKNVTIALATNDTHSNWYDLVNGILVKIAGHY
jgi:CubicO group peptidase (beta-lactamase class C family)